MGRNGSKDGPKGRTWEEKRVDSIYQESQEKSFLLVPRLTWRQYSHMLAPSRD
jgi:hypothetical protein